MVGIGIAAILLAAPRARAETAVGESSFALTSPAFSHGESIPLRHTCEGRNVSPPLSWSGVPKAARSLVLIVDDPDAPDPKAPRITWVHWILYNLPPGVGELSEGVTADSLPEGARAGRNGWGRAEYGGPCPPIGRHRYFHKLYALDILLPPDLGAVTKAQLERAMKGHILERAELVGRYQKRAR